MTRRRIAVAARKTDRRWHIPPPLLHGAEALEGGDVLQEISGPAGGVLWQALRDVVLWAQTPPEDRPALFVPGAQDRRLATRTATGLEAEIVDALHSLGEVVGKPAEADPEMVASACRQIAQWAEARGSLGTALAFSQDAALACPADAAAAFTVGRIARIAADYARAEVWFRRAIGLARQARDWRLYSRAFRGLGHLHWQRGNFPTARRFYMRALRGARRGGMRHEQGQALHDLFVLHVDMGRHEEAERFARSAFEAYGPRSTRLPMLAHDVAYWWMSEGYFARALKLFQVLLPTLSQPMDRLFALTNAARAAGGVGDAALFEAQWEEALNSLADSALAEGEARALLELAHGASSLGQWKRAAEAAERALAVASKRGEAKSRVTAEALLEWVNRQIVHLPVQTADAPAVLDSGDQFAEEFVGILRTRTAAA